jgi:asparagine N-glycosylation enzyme membrane subunit Stt3
MDIKSWIKKNYWIFALIAIFLFSYWIRSYNITPDKIVDFDPTYQLRFTKYFADWGHMPNWDELTYYAGRLVDQNTPPLMLYITATIHNIIGKALNFSLTTTASYMSAIFGALIILPAFLLIRKLSDTYSALFGAFLIGTAPQILIRTFGSSYDTDQMALFFILLNLYLGLKFLQNQTIKNFCWASIGILASVLAWAMSIYAFIVVIAASIFYFILKIILTESESNHITTKLKKEFKTYKKEILKLIGILLTTHILGIILKLDIIGSILSIIGFALKPEKWIVNISIAELQPFNIFNLDGWVMATGRFVTGISVIDTITILTILTFTITGLLYNYKKDTRKLSFILTLFSLGIYTTFRGIRFTEFSSVLFLIIIASGFGYLMKYLKENNKEKLLHGIAIGLSIFLIFIGANLGSQLGLQLGPSHNQNWEDAWNFIKTETPSDSIIGTWWDPGHMIATISERRNFADGAHCDNSCLYTINDRITDLGKIMATSSEAESLELIKKYKGTSSKVYWIASNDLISKYQWLQYFGFGCDYKTDPNCKLYQTIQYQNSLQNQEGEVVVLQYQNVIMLPGIGSWIPIYTENNQGYVIKNIISYDNFGNIQKVSIPDDQLKNISLVINPLTDQLNITLIEEALPITIWINKDYSYIVIIPNTLENTVFTKMFFLEGEGLENFKQVFRNDQVKIYEVLV